ncbi:XRE family transcriptional regulator [Longimicrobium sp.]|jgi:transcriptional regulator with XRE-family HTH domain|uniref:XRE family transcriptional regulator n=1 Tax=Longimicrobium sp. TaxID=2029185 RepID=UPI002F91D790
MAKKFRDLIAHWGPERIAQIEAEAAAVLREMRLDELRRARLKTQQDMAAALRTSQASVSKLERRTDMYLSTLRRYVQAMGGELEIIARFPEGPVRLEQFFEGEADGDADDDALLASNVETGYPEPVVAGRRARR